MNPVVQFIVGVIEVLTLPITFGLAFYIYRALAQNLPEHQIPNLERVARQAVRKTQRQHPKAPNRKELAVTSVTAQFTSHKLHIPNDVAINDAVESALWELDTLSKPNG